MDLGGRKVLVTGASAGIGEAITRLLPARGVSLAALARRRNLLDRLARETGAMPIPADARDHEAVADAVRSAADALGGVDALVNNAGTFRLGSVADGVVTDWVDMVEGSILGLLAATRAAIPYLVDSAAGQVVDISSMSGRRVAGPATGV